MKIQLGRYEEKASWLGTLGDYDNPDRYELIFDEVDVTTDELLRLINSGAHIKVNC